jgi:hypothetical protein
MDEEALGIKDGNYVHLIGREAGLLAWLLPVIDRSSWTGERWPSGWRHCCPA